MGEDVLVTASQILTVASENSIGQDWRHTRVYQRYDKVKDVFPESDGLPDQYAAEVWYGPEGQSHFDEVGNDAVH